jgi:DNA-binding HxlR family transcriptional regulator
MSQRRRADDDDTHEPLAKLLGILSSPWTLLLLHRLHVEGPKRFGELKRRLGAISTKTLTERLRMLEAEGWVTRHYEPTIPPQVTYAITELVLELDGVMSELDRIAERWYGKGGKPADGQSNERSGAGASRRRGAARPSGNNPPS